MVEPRKTRTDVTRRHAHYKDARHDSERLGFIIKDVGHGYAVLPSGKRVDVYGYASMAVAALQVQQAQLDSMRTELAKLKREVRRLRLKQQP